MHLSAKPDSGAAAAELCRRPAAFAWEGSLNLRVSRIPRWRCEGGRRRSPTLDHLTAVDDEHLARHVGHERGEREKRAGDVFAARKRAERRRRFEALEVVLAIAIEALGPRR